MSKKLRRHTGQDPWGRDSYNIPQFAVVGSSDCGTAPDSPANSERVNAELQRFQDDLLNDTGIASDRSQPTESGNVFMVKQWVEVSKDDWQRAADYAREWLLNHDDDTRHIHDADLPPLTLAISPDNVDTDDREDD